MWREVTAYSRYPNAAFYRSRTGFVCQQCRLLPQQFDDIWLDWTGRTFDEAIKHLRKHGPDVDAGAIARLEQERDAVVERAERSIVTGMKGRR